jgi:hypothetical protein
MGRTVAITIVMAFAFALLATTAGRYLHPVLGVVLAAAACTILTLGILIWVWQ